VTDANDIPITGVSVQVKDTNVGTVSRKDDGFSLAVPAGY
jgi:hypothetical protein